MSQVCAPRLEETKRHGSVLFPFNIYPCTIPKDFPTVTLHWHRSMELIFIKKGSGLVQLGKLRYTARAGDIFVVPPQTLHALRLLPGHVMEYENMIFDPEFLGFSAADICTSRYLIPLAGGQLLQPTYITREDPAYPEIVRCLTRAEDLCEQTRPGYELGVKGAMLQLLCLLITLYPQPPALEPADHALLRSVLQYVQEHYSQSITVAQAAALCGFSSSHFMRWFRQLTGSSFGAYVKECRLAAAAEQLRLTDEKILTVAGQCGFDSLANFNRQFKERYSLTPKEYRKGQASTPTDA